MPYTRATPHPSARSSVPKIYSHSRLSSFENCPKQFHFRYVLKIPQESESIEAFLGKRVHEVFERLYQFAARDQVPSLEQVIRRYRALFDEQFEPERVRVVRSGVPLSYYQDLGERCLRNYYQAHYPFDEGETLGLEERIHFDLDEASRYRFQGVIDRLARTPDGVIEIHDYKTGKRIPSQRNLDKDRQLALYQLGLSKRYGPDQPMRLVWHYVASGQRRSSTRSSEQLDALRRETIERIEQIQGELEFAPKKQALCDWCEYKTICPAWVAVEPKRAPAATPQAPAEPAAPSSPREQLDLL